MALRLIPRWQSGRHELDPRVLPLLRAIAGTGSLKGAVAAQRLSYRHAWGLLGRAERLLGHPLVRMQRGRGARLSEFAQKLLETDEAAAGLLTRETGTAVQALNRFLPPAEPRSDRTLTVHASHDFALAELRDLLRTSHGIPLLDLHFRGSLECLAGLARRECDIAGFHLPETSAGPAPLAPYRPALAIPGLRLVRFVRRRQGLMVPPGNPRRLASLADLARTGARFVNRQLDSGTRLCLDRLLAAAGIRPQQINGYATEEFTHAAVAATVASGMADAGFGIEAAAHRHRLDFVPLAVEHYYLAVRSATLARPEARKLLEALQDAEFLRRLRALPGYEVEGIGEIVAVKDVLEAPSEREAAGRRPPSAGRRRRNAGIRR